MRIIQLLCLVFLAVSGFSQTNFNMALVANVEVGDTGNDIWGYVDEATGIEYAIMGTVNNTRVFSLEDHANPVEIANIPGTNTTWRDIKTWQDKAYVVCDICPDGLLIIDFEDPENLTWEYKEIVLDSASNTLHTQSHNIYIDENGYAYLAGGNFVDGIIILDLNEDPSNPKVVGFEDTFYSHDVMVRGDTMWASHIFEGEFGAYDVTDKANPIYLGGTSTTSDFTHNAWISDDGKYLYTTDERANAFVDAYDITDLSNIRLLDAFQPATSAGNGVIPHNTHYIDSYLVTSWYTDGVVITDAHRPENLVKVGGYDTFLDADGGFGGCWGAYPWLPSGHVLASDRQTGLYVFNPTYQRACYLEGKVTNSENGQAIFNAAISVVGDIQINDVSDPTGNYATGRATSGTVEVNFNHPEFFPATAQAELINGEITILDVQLEPSFEVTSKITVKESFSENVIPDAFVYIFREQIDIFTNTEENGEASVTVFAGNYKIFASAWGYRNLIQDVSFDGTDIVLEMDRGYEDVFISDENWTESGDATTGKWERAIPTATVSSGQQIAPGSDALLDFGKFAYVTENAGGAAAQSDVDGGTTTLTSDIMDLTWYSNPMVHFATWFVNAGGTPPLNDNMTVQITNGTETVLLFERRNTSDEWEYTSNIAITGLEITDNMQLIVETSDVAPNGHLVEAGFDAFLVTDGTMSSAEDLDLAIDFNYFPNPAKDAVVIQWDEDDSQIRLFDFAGKLVKTERIQRGLTTIQIGDLEAGYYTMQLVTSSKVAVAKKLLKID